MERIKKPKVVAIIPARGGSKRLPRKNILLLNGIPLITRVIRTVNKSSIFDDIIVSSDDNEIISIAKKEKVIVHERPKKLSTDVASVADTCLNVISSNPTDIFCCVYATAALISTQTLQNSLKKFLSDSNANVLMGVSKYNFNPVQALTLSKNGYAKMLFAKFRNLKSQKYPMTRVSNGTFYWARYKNFLREKTFYSNKLKTFDVPDDEVCDIDTLENFIQLKKKFRLKNKKKI